MEQDKQHTALLVMDMQAGILANYPTETAPLVENVKKAIDHARKEGIPVIYVVVGFRNGFPEISMRNKGFSAIKERMATANLEDWMKVHDAVAPQGSEVTVYKRRISAFAGSDLEVILRAQEIRHMVLTGIATSGVVLSTLREAADKDYQMSVLADACYDADEEIHRVLTTKLFPRQADVTNVDEWVAKK